MKFASKEALAAYLWENPDLQRLNVENCPGSTNLSALPSSLDDLRVCNCPGITEEGAFRLGKLRIEIR